MEKIQLPTPPPDYGYVVTLLSCLLTLALLAVVAGIIHFFKYRDRIDKERKDEALALAAKQELKDRADEERRKEERREDALYREKRDKENADLRDQRWREENDSRIQAREQYRKEISENTATVRADMSDFFRGVESKVLHLQSEVARLDKDVARLSRSRRNTNNQAPKEGA